MMQQLNLQKIRADFPILSMEVNKKPLVYLDNGATSQKPLKVINAIEHYYRFQNSNIHRGVHYLSQIATEAYENSRQKIASFLNAEFPHEIIFTKGTTDGINLIAQSFAKKYIQKGDEILISAMEHHSNIVPWQIVCEEKEAHLKVIPMNKNGELLMDEFYKLLNPKVKIIALTHVSNSLGTINPIKEIIDAAHQINIPVLIDGAQAVQHFKIDLQQLDADFYAFSGHKLFAPTGIGVLYGKEKWLNALPPYQGGGDMIKSVSFEKTVYNELPFKFEAGTPNIEGAICLQSAIEYMEEIGLEAIQQHENELLEKATNELSKIDGIEFIGTARNKASVISFNLKNIHPYDVGVILDKMGIAVRTGHHCTQPIMDFYQIPGTVRASFAFYNNFDDINALINAVNKAKQMLS